MAIISSIVGWIKGHVEIIVAISAAGGALWAGWEAHMTRLDDERPYVYVNQGSLKLTVDKEFVYTVMAPKIEGAGKTPAINVRVAGRCSSDKEHGPTLPLPVYDQKSPGKDGFLIINVPSLANGQTLIEDLQNYCGTKNSATSVPFEYYLDGTVQYDDLYGRHHQTTFCIKSTEFADGKKTPMFPCTDFDATFS
jgi:hypothetical protein